MVRRCFRKSCIAVDHAMLKAQGLNTRQLTDCLSVCTEFVPINDIRKSFETHETSSSQMIVLFGLRVDRRKLLSQGLPDPGGLVRSCLPSPERNPQFDGVVIKRTLFTLNVDCTQPSDRERFQSSV